MVTRIFGLDGFLVAGGIALAGFIVGSIVGATKGERRRALLRGLESALVALAGGFVSRAFVSLLLGAGGDSHGAGLAVGWGFFLWPGAVDTIVALFGGGPVLTQPAVLLTLASGVGGFGGMMDGLWRVHRWKGPGFITFLADFTWGLAGTTNGCLFHLINFAWAGHPDEPRTGAHRYRRGFRFKPGYAVTQGNVMSGTMMNGTDHGPGNDLYNHEAIHVLQNRVFGPLFTLTYLGWMATLLLPGLIAGLASRRFGVGEAVQWWCYYNAPWEVWAYRIGGYRAHSDGALCWSLPLAIALAAVFFIPVLGLSVWIIASVWL